MILTRRSLITTALGLVAAPTIVRVASIMPVRPVMPWPLVFDGNKAIDRPTILGLCRVIMEGESVEYGFRIAAMNTLLQATGYLPS